MIFIPEASPIPRRDDRDPGVNAPQQGLEHTGSMDGGASAVVVGLDVGGTKTNATVLDEDGRFLVDRMVEVASCVGAGPEAAVAAAEDAMELVLELTGTGRDVVRAIGLDTPGPASAGGVISARGATNFAAPEWWRFDFRTAVERQLRLPVIYHNDGNAAALYAHEQHFGAQAPHRSSVAAIVGTGLGGGVIEAGRVVSGAAGMAGELGHIQIPMDGLLDPGQPVPRCNCGLAADLESVASLSGIVNNLLPYWLTRYPDHRLARLPIVEAAREVRHHGEEGDEMARRIFEQQAAAIGRMFTIAANFTDPHAYFLGGGVTDAAVEFRTWFLDRVREHTLLREEQAAVATFALVPDLDMAGARGSALAALRAIRP
jgi:predicted NBD/HSP70 family sugar kinase